MSGSYPWPGGDPPWPGIYPGNGQICPSALPDIPVIQDWLRTLFDYLSAGRSWGINPSQFGAVGDGVNDDTGAIQAALDVGGTVRLEAKPYKITSTLFIGNGSASGVSTKAPTYLIGSSPLNMPTQFFTGYPASASSRLLWHGDSASAMIAVRGPLIGWGVSNLTLDGSPSGDWGGLANIGLHVIAAMNGDCPNLTISGCRNTGLYSESVHPPAGVSVTGSFFNSYKNLSIGVGWQTGSKGIVLTGVSDANTCYNIFENLSVALPTTTVSYGVYLQACDSNIFINPHFFNGLSGCSAFVFDYTVNSSWPAGNRIVGPDWGGLAAPVLVDGAPDSTARPNFIIGINEANGGLTPTNLVNTNMDSSVVRTFREVGQVNPSGPQILCTILTAGLYRLSYYLLVTGGPATGGTISLSLAWLDGVGAQAFTAPDVPNSPGNQNGGQITVWCEIPSQIGWAVNFHSVSPGNTQYELVLSAERII